MFAKLLRFSAMMTAPMALAAMAHADTNQQPVYGADQQQRAAIILFSGEGFSGDVREVFDPVAALPDLRFNDKARSVAILEGQWEVCENSDFTGRCVFLREDVESLDFFRLNREISSVRPIYEYTDAQHGLMFNRDRQGRIQYAQNQRYSTEYGYNDGYNDGYQRDTRVIVEHYGYSDAYRTRGYYDPFARNAYGPYGFGYSHYDTFGNRGYAYSPRYRNHRTNRRPQRTHRGVRNGAITLYEHSNARGQSLGLNDSVSDLRRYRLNNNLSSVGVTRGSWEVCDRPNFQGTCRVLDAPNGFLNLTRDFNDRASSIRRVDAGPRTGGNRGHRDGVGRRAGRGDGVARRTGRNGDGTSRRRGQTAPQPVARSTRNDRVAVAPNVVTQPRRPSSDRVNRRGGDRLGRNGGERRADRVGRTDRVNRTPRTARADRPARPAVRPNRPAPRVQAPRPQPRSRPQRVEAPRPRPQKRAKPQVQRPRPQRSNPRQDSGRKSRD